jgi:hypothetical protein
MAGIEFSQRVSNITYQELIPRLVDQINNSNIWTARLLSDVKEWTGVTLNMPIEVANSTTGDFFTGMDTFPTAATDNIRLYTWYLGAFEQSVVVPGIERDVNANNEKQVLRLLTTRLDEAKISAAVSIAGGLYGIGDGATFDGLGLIVDNGTNTSSYGGVTRSANPFVNADVTSVTNGQITLDYLSTEFDNISAVGSTSESPTIGLTTKSIWTDLETIMQVMLQARYDVVSVKGYDRVSGGTPKGVQVKDGDTRLGAVAGFRSIAYRGIPVIPDDMAPSETFFYLNEHYLDFYALKAGELESMSSNIDVQEGFYMDVNFPSFWQFRQMMSPVNQYGQMGFLMLMGNQVCSQPRRQGKLINITGS